MEASKIEKVEYLDKDKEVLSELTRGGEAKVYYLAGVYTGQLAERAADGIVVREGKGTYEFKSGAKYSGTYKNDKRHGKGKYTYASGSASYEGEWTNGEKNGHGKEIFDNGDRFEGQYANDQFSGEGVYFYTSGAVLTGTWQDGDLVSGEWKSVRGSRRLSTRGILSKLGKRVSTRRKKTAQKHPLGIIISGAPASGKGTQCEFIREEFGVIHLSTGDMLRAAVAAGSELGRKAKELMESGQLVPDEIVIGAVKERLAQEDVKQNGFLLDGFPRTAAQAKALDELNIKVDAFIMLNVPDSALVARVCGRRIDPETGNSYHVEFNPPPAEIEDRLIQRADDTEEKVKVRLQGFHKNIKAIKSFYTDIISEIDGVQPKNDVWEQIRGEIRAVANK